ncbi:ribosome-releasing factor 2, mitochondrial isoform X2 [Cylas formicarius]|uniref:ribosome-releasing factor 2, mitochondrial isoform X2 n=1 Tax=Cylas formicarius TaxID=197179 RepID=UPI002958CAC7|nr:ribosome-releasing factor 2, mitochondrial isoform X2 [Cylas formicarius]
MLKTISKLCSSFKTIHKLYYSSKVLQNVDIEYIRNIGILAHIDAGKTTTTERMLYYAGLINEMGEVHHGNTVTDYMDQERERDTPGHIDFTMEVEQTLNVLDGAIIILDASAGVEAQTLMVWRQADRHKIPRIIYVNKMDRSDASVQMCCTSIEKKLETPTFLLQLPLIENGKFLGIIDLVSMQLLKYSRKERNVTKILLSESEFPKYWCDAMKGRSLLLEKLGDFDDEFANLIISSNSYDTISSVDVIKVLNKIVVQKTGVPVVLGSSYKNIGVQSLMDAVILYLPSPSQTKHFYSAFEDNFCGRAFKVRHDKQRGPLVFLRIYNGLIKKNQTIYNVQREKSEAAGRVYIAYADEFQEASSVGAGNIAVVSGLKKTMSGDLLTSSLSTYHKAQKNFAKLYKETQTDLSDSIFGGTTYIPPPVFFCSIEPSSMASQTVLENVLAELEREDPSLRVTYDSETGQTILAGMGELHLDIIRDRIVKEYKLDVDLGPLQIAYRETPVEQVSEVYVNESKIGKFRQYVKLHLSIVPGATQNDKDILKYDKSPDNASNIAAIFPKQLVALKHGILIGLTHGPKISSQVMNSQVILHWLEVGRGTSETFLSATASQLIKKLLEQSGTNILEPIMNLEILAPSEHASGILHDLARRRAVVKDVSTQGNTRVISAEVPLSELMGYSTYLRTLSSGTATFTAEFFEYQQMSSGDEHIAIKQVRGF